MSTSPISNRLASKACIITGASSGVGRAIALAFAANGAGTIICSDLRPDPRGTFGNEEGTLATHELLCKRYGDGKAIFVKADVTKAEDVERMVQEAVKVAGRLDVMVNNAGSGGTETAGPIHEQSEEYYDFTMAVNTKSVFLGCKYAIKQFLSQPPHQPSNHRGWIINTASMLGVVGLKPGAAAYCASKGATVLLTKQIAVEYGSDKIHCNALCPGYLTTPMTAPIYENETSRKELAQSTPWGDWGKPEDVANCAVFLASDEAGYVTGLSLGVDGGYTAQ